MTHALIDIAAILMLLTAAALLYQSRKHPTATPKVEAQPICTDSIHFWVPIQAQPTTINPPSIFGHSMGNDHKGTLVLKRCGLCHAHATFAYDGEWELEAFLRKQSSAAELNDLYAPKGESR